MKDGVTARSVALSDGPSRLYRFHAERGPSDPAAPPVLIIPSMINRWYVVDLRPGASLVAGLLEAGLDVWCLDWGISGDEDRYFTWDDVLARLRRHLRAVRRQTGADRVGLVGYCMGGTLATIHTALHPADVACLVDLLGPIDFRHGGLLARMVDRRWFNADAAAGAGNIAARQMQSGFVALRPTTQLAKWITLADRAKKPGFVDSFRALDRWSNDNIPFPAAAYTTYISELYQQNALFEGAHRVAGQLVNLARITAPVLSVTATRDHICPPACADALLGQVSSEVAESLQIEGGHIGSVVGSKAARTLYPALGEWLRTHTVPARAAA